MVGMRKTRTKQSARALGAALTLVCIAPSALADDAAQARILYQKANAYFRKGDDVMAREYFRQSLELQESFDTICNYGRSEARSKLWLGAYEKLGLCLYVYPTDKELAADKQKFAELREKVKYEIDVFEVDEIDAKLKAEFARREKEKAAAAAATTVAPESAEPVYSPYRLPVSASVAGLGVVGLGVGVGFLVHSGAQKGKAEDELEDLVADGGHCVEGEGPDPDCVDVQDLRDSSDQAQHVALGSLIAGGALLVGGVLTYFLWPESKVAETARPVLHYEKTNGQWTFGFEAQF
jgi:hypothetical protein